MKRHKKNWFNSVLALLLLCTMALKMGVTLIHHFSGSTETLSIEKNAEEGKDTKEESFGKGDKKMLFAGRILADNIHYANVVHAKPVCRYRMQEVSDPPQSVATPPPNPTV